MLLSLLARQQIIRVIEKREIFLPIETHTQYLHIMPQKSDFDTHKVGMRQGNPEMYEPLFCSIQLDVIIDTLQLFSCLVKRKFNKSRS